MTPSAGGPQHPWTMTKHKLATGRSPRPDEPSKEITSEEMLPNPFSVGASSAWTGGAISPRWRHNSGSGKQWSHPRKNPAPRGLLSPVSEVWPADPVQSQNKKGQEAGRSWDQLTLFLWACVWTLQRMKSESCSVVPTLCDPMDCSPTRLLCPWNSPGWNTGVDSCSLLHVIFPTQGSNPGLPHCWQILYHLSHQGSPRILQWVAYPFSKGSSGSRNRTRVSCIAGGFFTSWATREALGPYITCPLI